MSNQEIFKESGYLKEDATKNLPYLQIKRAIANKIMKTKYAIADRELELLKIKNYLSCLEHEDRIVWLTYGIMDDNVQEKT